MLIYELQGFSLTILSFTETRKRSRKRVRQGKGKVCSDDGMRGFRTALLLREIWLFGTDKDISI